jgi:GNAT superfamily N-acetyltransferase
MPIRAAEPADAEALVDRMLAAFEGYRAIAPAGWEPPDERVHLERLRGEIADPDAFTLIAEGAGHVHWVPLGDPVDIHLRHLFIDPPYWGTGLARELHRAAIEAMGGRTARLYTPVGQARARRFYEREGWTHVGDEAGGHFGMPFSEYRR